MGDWNKETNWNGDATNTFGDTDQWNGDGADNGNGSAKAFDAIDQAAGYSGGGGAGGCFNCGEDGHMKVDCPQPLKPREFTGECRECGEVGHQARSCPKKPKICKQCNAENDHDTIDCKNKKFIDRSRVEDKSVEEAWAMLKEADDEPDISDFREAVQVLVKALNGDLTYLQLEKECREKDFTIHLVALEKEVPDAYTNVDLEGNVGKKYTLGYFTSGACPRPILMSLWPKNASDNLERLRDVGIPMERGVPICGNCDTLGHVRKDCPDPKREYEGAKVKCALCDGEGHRVRDCPEERPQPKERAPRACKICGSEEHIAKECDNRPPEMCHNCYQEGHRKSDCNNERVWKCNNCEEIGHKSSECKAPKDWSKHKCRHCGELGHGSENRCDPEKKAAFVAAKAAEEGNADGGEGFGGGFETSGGGFEAATNDFQGGSGGNNDWNTTTTSAPAASGGW